MYSSGMSALGTPTPDSTTDTPPRQRRWNPLSLRMFVAILSLLGAASALWIGVPAYRQHVAIREIELLGGYVVTEERGPDWLRQWFSRETMRRFEIARNVNLSETEVTDEALRCVECLGDLEELNLSRTRITDEGLKRLKDLTNLDWLILEGTRVTDDGLGHLNGLTNLRFLDLGNTKVSDGGIGHLTGLSKLSFLYLNETNVTGAGLGQLKSLTKLEVLWLTGIGLNETNVAGTGLDELKAALPKLEIDRR